MADEALTKPTLETILTEMREFRFSVERRLDIMESQLVQMDARNDRQEGLFYQIRAELLGLRADFKEFRVQFKAPA